MVDKRKEIRNSWKPLTILFILSLTVCSTILTRSVSALPPIMTTFKVEPEISVARAGQIITVAVNAYDLYDFWGWQIAWFWDYTVLDYVGHTFAGFLVDQPEGSTTTSEVSLVDNGYMLCTELTLGEYPGITADWGWLMSVTFEVVGEADALIDIDDPTTYWMQDAVTFWGTEEGEMIKENADFMAPWPEDIYVDGFIDALDLANVALDWGKCVVQTRDPSTYTGTGWTSPYYALDSDNLHTSTSTDGASEEYGGYGFVTTAWTSVSKVEVGVEVKTDSGGNEKLYIEVWNGAAWSTTGTTLVVENTEDEFQWIDMTAAFSWTPSMIDAIKVSIEYDKAGGTGTPMYIDWLPVRVTPTPMARNPYSDVTGDGTIDIADLSRVCIKYGQYAGY